MAVFFFLSDGLLAMPIIIHLQKNKKTTKNKNQGKGGGELQRGLGWGLEVGGWGLSLLLIYVDRSWELVVLFCF